MHMQSSWMTNKFRGLAVNILQGQNQNKRKNFEYIMQDKKLCSYYNHKEQTIFCRGRVGLSASAVELNEEVLHILSEVLSIPSPQDTTESALYRKPWVTDTALQNSNKSKSKPSA